MTGNVMEGKIISRTTGRSARRFPPATVQTITPMQNEVSLAITNSEIFPSYVTTQTATNAYKMVLSDVGCNLPTQDLIDQRVIGEVHQWPPSSRRHQRLSDYR